MLNGGMIKNTSVKARTYTDRALGKMQSQLYKQIEHLEIYIKELHKKNVELKERIILLEKT